MAEKAPGAKRLVKAHIWEGAPEPVQEAKEGESDAAVTFEKTAKDRHKERAAALEEAPELNDVLLTEWGKTHPGEEAPQRRNLALMLIDEWRIDVKKAEALREAIKGVKAPAEKAKLMALYNEKRKDVQGVVERYGPSFEKSYRAYMGERLKFYDFTSKRRELVKLKNEAMAPEFAEAAKADISEKSRSRIEDVAAVTSLPEQQDAKEMLESLATIYGEVSPEYQEAAREIQSHMVSGEKLGSKAEIGPRTEKLEKEVRELWEENPMVRYFYHLKELEDMGAALSRGDDVLETQSVIHALNKLWSWEHEHQRTTIGGVLVGPPGVGKTTLVHHYLEKLDREMVYIDLSEDITRYLLYGSKNIEFKTTAEYQSRLIDDLKGLSNEDFDKFLKQNTEMIQEAFHLEQNEAAITLLSQLEEEVDKAGKTLSDTERAGSLTKIKDSIVDRAKQAYNKELATQFHHVVKKNGWRDGVIISALRRGDSILFDEFNKNRNWSLIYGLMTAKPGDKWYFADNDEQIEIPEDWRMYFTANIGRKHGVFEVPEALASRAGGKVLELDYPPTTEEIDVALLSIATPDGDILRSKEDVAKLVVLINNVIPNVRKALADEKGFIPISYRTIRDLSEKLVKVRDPKTDALVYQPTNKSMDEAMYEVLIDTYALYEGARSGSGKTAGIAVRIADFMGSAGLLLSDEVKPNMVKILGEARYDELRQTKDAHPKAFDEIIDEVMGRMQKKAAMAGAVPEASAA